MPDVHPGAIAAPLQPPGIVELDADRIGVEAFDVAPAAEAGVPGLRAGGDTPLPDSFPSSETTRERT
jgi:hypothetical protein